MRPAACRPALETASRVAAAFHMSAQFSLFLSRSEKTLENGKNRGEIGDGVACWSQQQMPAADVSSRLGPGARAEPGRPPGQRFGGRGAATPRPKSERERRMRTDPDPDPIDHARADLLVYYRSMDLDARPPAPPGTSAGRRPTADPIFILFTAALRGRRFSAGWPGDGATEAFGLPGPTPPAEKPCRSSGGRTWCRPCPAARAGCARSSFPCPSSPSRRCRAPP